MHALLHSSQLDHIILIQEPWFDKIGTAWKDSAREGVDVLGGIASLGWEGHYPTMPAGGCAKVMAYMRKRSWEHLNDSALFSATARQDLCSHQCILILDIAFDDRTWRLVNFYNDIRDKMVLDMLLELDLDLTIPMLVVRDFNTHSQSWSPQDVPPSQWVDRLEEWAISNLLTLANEPGIVTRKGADHKCDSTINLT